MWAFFALLEPDLDSEYGSGSTDPIEYGSNTDPDPVPDPQPCFLRKAQFETEVALLIEREGKNFLIFFFLIFYIKCHKQRVPGLEAAPPIQIVIS